MFRGGPAVSVGQIAISFVVVLVVAALAQSSPATAAQCARDGGYDRSEIAQSTFFTTREQTKFAPSERHYPLATGASARYCFARGCAGQITVGWNADEQAQLRRLREEMVSEETAQSELQFIRIAVLRLETWLHGRLRNLDQSTVDRITRRIAGYYGATNSADSDWVTSTLAKFDRFDKECATYAMEATQHLLVLANLGLMKHWNVTAPVYRFGIPGHWTAGLENRQTCERYRFDLNTRASVRYGLHSKGQDPARIALESAAASRSLFPGMDRAGSGTPTSRRDRPPGASALKGPPR